MKAKRYEERMRLEDVRYKHHQGKKATICRVFSFQTHFTVIEQAPTTVKSYPSCQYYISKNWTMLKLWADESVLLDHRSNHDQLSKSLRTLTKAKRISRISRQPIACQIAI